MAVNRPKKKYCGERRLAGQERSGHGRRVVEVHDPGAAGQRGDQQPGRVLRHLLATTLARASGALSSRMRALRSPSITRSTHMKRSVQTVCGQVKPHQTRPPRLVARNRPKAPRIRSAGEVIDFLRPDLDPEEVSASARHVDQHRLIRRARAAVPAQPRHDVVDAEQHDQDRPLDRAGSGRGPPSGRP